MAEIDNYDKSVDVGLRNLDKLVIDPMLKERLSDAQDLWRKLLPQIESEEDLAQAISSLDADCWGPYMGQQALLTGWVEEVDVFSRGSLCRRDPEGSSGGVEDLPVQSMGFTVIVGEDDSYSLGLLYKLDAVDKASNPSPRYLAASCDQLLSFPGVVSLEHMCALLEEYLPGLTSQIDEAVLNTAKGRGEALGALKGLDYSELEEIAERDPVLYGKLSVALPSYVNMITDLDTAMPYVIDYDGPVVFDNGNSLGFMSQGGLAATMYSLKIAEPIPGLDKTGITLAVSCKLHRGHQDEDIEVELPVDYIKDPVSTRDAAYSEIL